MLLHIHSESLLGCVFTLTKGVVEENRSQSEDPLLANVCLDNIDYCWSSYGSSRPAHIAVPCLLKQIPPSLELLHGNLRDHEKNIVCLALLVTLIINYLLTITSFWTSSSLNWGCQGFRAGQNTTMCFGSMINWQLDENSTWLRFISTVANTSVIVQSSEFRVDRGTISLSLCLLLTLYFECCGNFLYC